MAPGARPQPWALPGKEQWAEAGEAKQQGEDKAVTTVQHLHSP